MAKEARAKKAVPTKSTPARAVPKKALSSPTKAASSRSAVRPVTPSKAARKPPTVKSPKSPPVPTTTAIPKPRSRAPADKDATQAAAPRTPVQKTRVVFPKEVYEPQKDAIKAPFKAHGLKWNFLGEGKGLYKKEGVNVFTQFLEDGVHYSLWGSDEAVVKDILRSWETLMGRSFVQQAQAAGEQAQQAEAAVKESEALRLWKLQEPQPRPGEPDLFLKKRHAEWLAKKPV